MTSINNFAVRPVKTASTTFMENSIGLNEGLLWLHPEISGATDGGDHITGNDRKNTLNGGLGADTMEGLRGHDTYFVDNTGDVVLEGAQGGTDSVFSVVSYTLGDYVENLTLAGIDSINATGNSKSNHLEGNAGKNLLNGLGGNDTLIGGYGDTLVGGSGHDFLVANGGGSFYGGRGDDTVQINDFARAPYESSSWIVAGETLTASSGGSEIKYSLQRYVEGGGRYGIGSGNIYIDGIENISIKDAGSGDDLVFALGNGTVYGGGGGTDTFYADWSKVTSDITWVNDGSAVTINGAEISGMERLLITTGGGDDYIDNLANFLGSDDISTGAGNDTIANILSPGFLYRDTISAGDGDDLIANVELGGIFYGGNGNDTLEISLLDLESPAAEWVIGAHNLNFSSSKSDIDSAFRNYDGGLSFEWFYIEDIENLSIKDAGRGDNLVFALGNGTVYGGGEGTDTFYADWSKVTSDITWVNDGSAVTINGAEISGMERLLITTGSGNDLIDNRAFSSSLGDEINTGAGNDLIFSGMGSDVITTGSGLDTFVVQAPHHNNSKLTDFTSGSDRVAISQAGLAVGNGDATIDAAEVTAGRFSASAELVIFTTDIEDDTISARSAAAAIGTADSSYTTGQRAIFAVDNGAQSLIYAFTSSGNDATVSASELTLLATLQGTASTTLSDYVFTL